LDFDEDTRKTAFEVAADSSDSKELLEEMTGSSKSKVGIASKKPAGDADSRATLLNEDSPGEEVITPEPVWLVPAPSGPKVDTGSKDTITSFIGWEAAEGKSCGEPADDTQKLMKSRALGNVISRLTGDENSFLC